MEQNNGITEIKLDYPIHPRMRYGGFQGTHQRIYDILLAGASGFQRRLEGFLQYKEAFTSIRGDREAAGNELDPVWSNGFLPGLDSVALYGFLADERPPLYIEIGSGNSTKIARRVIQDQGLETRIISIDPHPRAEVDELCDEIIRQPLEEVDLEVFDQLKSGDVLFFDGSHRVFMNSDVVVFFLDILPRLPAGVWVQIHDIFLPNDYPDAWVERHYSEQYMLAVALLSNSSQFEVTLPNHFITLHPELSLVLDPLWKAPQLAQAEPHGVSFWIRTK